MKKLLLLLFLLFIPFKINGLEVSAKSAILMDESGRILYAKDIDTKRLIASTTKIMTSIIAIESNRLEEIVTIKEDILKSYGSNIYVTVGENAKKRK